MLVKKIYKKDIVEDCWIGRKFLCKIRDGDFLHFDILTLDKRILGVTHWFILENDEHIISLSSEQVEEVYFIIEE